MSFTSIFSRPELLALMIPIVAIITFGVVAVVKMIISHQERMAMIERGMHPDESRDEEDSRCG